MSTDAQQIEAGRNAIWGALVADAAAMGLHWIYDQNRITEVAAERPEFRTPDKQAYEAVLSFYAHPDKRAGDFSHYGEQLMAMLNSLSVNKGQYSKSQYQQSFCAHFGYGGSFVGYIDRPTRDTLDNMLLAEKAALEAASSVACEADHNTKQALISKVMACVKQGVDSSLVQRIEEAVKAAHDERSLIDYAQKIAHKIKNLDDYQGADDSQLPAVSKLPPLVALYRDDAKLLEMVESAVRVTNNNDFAVACGKLTASMLASVIAGKPLDDALHLLSTARQESSESKQAAELIRAALSFLDQDNLVATKNFGMSCNLKFGLPGVFHNLMTSNSYVEAIRNNIRAGGDSCGRAILLGSLCGAVYGIGGATGIPQEWIDRLTQKVSIQQKLDSLFTQGTSE